MTGKNLHPQSQQFTGWQSYGDASVTNPFSMNTTLSLQAPSSAVHYSGAVNLSLPTPTQTYTVPITIHAFVDVPTATTFASVTICSSPTSCPFKQLQDGATVQLNLRTVYAFSGYPSAGYKVNDWTTDAGTISNYTLSTAQIYVQSSGVVSLVVTGEGGGAGYFADSPGSSQTVFSASAQIIVPYLNNNNFDGDSVWVGIGGFGSGLSLWQAGFEVANGNILAFWEAIPANANGPIVPNSTMSIVPGNVLLVSVTSSAGISNATITNLNNSEVWRITDRFTPSTTSADWIVEPKAINAFGAGQTVLFESLDVNLAAITLQGCFLAAYIHLTNRSVLYPSLLYEGAGNEVYFYVY